MEIERIWETLERTAAAMEKGEGDWYANARIAQQSIQRLFDFPPEDIVSEARQSHYPTKALVKWLLYEGEKIEGVSVASLEGLCAYWNENMGEEGFIDFPVTL